MARQASEQQTAEPQTSTAQWMLQSCQRTQARHHVSSMLDLLGDLRTQDDARYAQTFSYSTEHSECTMYTTQDRSMFVETGSTPEYSQM
jgi:hypothetical protein